MRDFSNKFFETNNLEKMSWFKFDFPKKLTEDIVKIQDVDILVKIVADC